MEGRMCGPHRSGTGGETMRGFGSGLSACRAGPRNAAITNNERSDAMIEFDEAHVQGEVEHAKRKARQMIVDDLFQFADDHRAYHELEQPLALAIDLLHDELEAWAKQTDDQ